MQQRDRLWKRRSGEPAGSRLRVVDAEAAAASAPAASRDRYGPAFVVVLGLAVLIRAGFVLGSDFPLNDGGLFLQMTRDVQAAGYALPETTGYNGESIRFAYPPLGFYLAAALDDLTPLTLFDVFRVLPLAGSIAAVAAFVVLARTMLPGRTHVLVAVTAFVMLPATFQWMIMGGGITRAPGFALAMLAIATFHRLYEQPTRARWLLAGALGAAALLSHLEMGLVVAYSAALFFIARGRSRDGLTATAGAIATATVLAAPWLVTVVSRHGIAPFVAAAQSGTSSPLQPVLLLLQYQLTIEPFFPLLAALALLGTGLLLAQRAFLLPAWILATAIFDPRAFPTSASFIVAMLAAYGVVDVVLPLLRNTFARGDGDDVGVASPPRWLLPAACTLGVVYVTLSALVTSPRLLTGMTPDERDAMTWVRENTPQTSSFVIVSDDRWPIDRTSEWFPLLAERTSVATVQGQEWIDGGAFKRKIAEYERLQECADLDAGCIEEWARDTGNEFDYVYIPKIAPRFAPTAERDCCHGIQLWLNQEDGYAKVYDGDGAVIFERK